MENIPFRFEHFPNEIIMDICKYLDAREVYQIFSNLNFRFKTLLQSFHHLQLSVSLFDSIDKQNYQYLFPHIQTLTIERGINTNLKHFKYLRYLILHNPKEKIFEQLQAHILFHIEYISITHKFVTSTIQSLITDLHKKIFSNDFYALKSCNLSDMKVSIPIETWEQSPRLYILKVGSINTLVFQAILSACPNLYYLKLKKHLWDQLTSNIKIHSNLRHLVIEDEDQAFPWNDSFIKNYLSYVPNLERLTVHRTNFFLKITNYMNYSWLIRTDLHFLRYFSFVLHINGSKQSTKCYVENVLFGLKEHFMSIHKDRYEARIRFVQN
jgi:hypothetical protein